MTQKKWFLGALLAAVTVLTDSVPLFAQTSNSVIVMMDGRLVRDLLPSVWRSPGI